MPGDVDQVALVNVLTTAQPSSPHAAPIQDVGEGPLDDLGPLAHGLFADARLQTGAIVADRPARLFVPVPAGKCRAPRLGDPGRPGATVQAFQNGARMVAFVGHTLRRRVRRRLAAGIRQMAFGTRQRALDRPGVALVGGMQFGRRHRAGVEIDGVFRLVGEMRGPVLHLGDAGLRVRLGHAPTPIDPAPNLGAALGIDLFIKRDDCTGLAFGGNKVRQLEFHFGEARASGADTVLVTGAVQSNLVRIAAAAARKLGMAAHIQLEDRVADGGETYRTSGNLLLDRVLGATLHPFPGGEDEAAADAALERRAEMLAAEGHRPYVIHSAPGHAPLGGLGYVLAAEEIVDQAPGTGFDAVVCASGSALTHGGLLVGLGRSASGRRCSASACAATPRARAPGWRGWPLRSRR